MRAVSDARFFSGMIALGPSAIVDLSVGTTLLSKKPSPHNTVVQSYIGTVVRSYSGTVVQWCSGSNRTIYSGTVIPFSRTVVQWYQLYSGAMVQ